VAKHVEGDSSASNTYSYVWRIVAMKDEKLNALWQGILWA
jgi:hypothetical protein